MAKKVSSKKKKKVIPKVVKREYVTLTEVMDLFSVKYDDDYADALCEWLNNEYVTGKEVLVRLLYARCDEDLKALSLSRSVLPYKILLGILRQEFPGQGLDIFIDT